MDDALLKLITETANHPKVIKHLEPNIFSHREATPDIVARVWYAILLINDTAKEEKVAVRRRKQGNHLDAGQGGGAGLREVPTE